MPSASSRARIPSTAHPPPRTPNSTPSDLAGSRASTQTGPKCRSRLQGGRNQNTGAFLLEQRPNVSLMAQTWYPRMKLPPTQRRYLTTPVPSSLTATASRNSVRRVRHRSGRSRRKMGVVDYAHRRSTQLRILRRSSRQARVHCRQMLKMGLIQISCWIRTVENWYTRQRSSGRPRSGRPREDQ